jgi:hypothetical protein
MVTITDSAVAGEDLRAARLAAARHGGDAVLVVTGASAPDHYSNWAALLYVTIVGVWVVPGSRVEASSLQAVRSGTFGTSSST